MGIRVEHTVDDFVVDIHGDIEPAFIAEMIGHLREAVSWRVNSSSSIPVLRCMGPDGFERMYVMDMLIMPADLPKRRDAPKAFADRARELALDALSASPSTDEDIDQERERLNSYARIAHHITDCDPDIEMACYAKTPWTPPLHIQRGSMKNGMTDDVLALAPRLYEIGASGDSSLRHTSIALYATSARSGKVDPIEALRAFDSLKNR